MILRRMPIIQLYLACQESMFVVKRSFFLVLYFYSTKKILGISTISRPDHAVAQTRELQCTMKVIPQVTNRGNFYV